VQFTPVDWAGINAVYDANIVTKDFALNNFFGDTTPGKTSVCFCQVKLLIDQTKKIDTLVV
jgi:hypothetical protein